MQITPISATYTSSPVIKLKVSWTGARTYRHNIKVWVFVDYRKIENNAPVENWTRAAVSGTPTVNSTPTSTTATLVSGNDNGFWLNGVDGDYSATVTATLSGVPAQFNWCAYATDYPPNVVPHSTSSYTLRGSPPFVINGDTLPVNQTTYSGTITSFTDATGAPGLFPAALNEKPNGMGCVAGLVENTSGVCITQNLPGGTNSIDLGTVSFIAGTDVTIVGNGISQIWSRPVTATGCQKDDFKGGTFNGVTLLSLIADCKKSVNNTGDYFSGCVLLRQANQLCPPPWRVPVRQDYLDLMKALGGETTVIASQTFVENKLMNTWGGIVAGIVNAQRPDGKQWDDGVMCYSYNYIYDSEPILWNTGIVYAVTAVTTVPIALPVWGYAVTYGGAWVGLPLRCVRQN
jgi:hypothetical protein